MPIQFPQRQPGFMESFLEGFSIGDTLQKRMQDAKEFDLRQKQFGVQQEQFKSLQDFAERELASKEATRQNEVLSKATSAVVEARLKGGDALGQAVYGEFQQRIPGLANLPYEKLKFRNDGAVVVPGPDGQPAGVWSPKPDGSGYQFIPREKPQTPASTAGKTVADRELFVSQYGADSPQVTAFDELTAKEEKGAAAPKLTDERGLRQEFTKESQDFVAIRDSFIRIETASKDSSPAGDLAILFNYMKALDPGARITDRDFLLAAQTGSFPQQVQAAALKLIKGERLTDEMRADFVAQAGNLFRSQLQSQERLEGEFRRIAQESGIEPSKVIVDFVGERRQKGKGRSRLAVNPKTGAVLEWDGTKWSPVK